MDALDGLFAAGLNQSPTYTKPVPPDRIVPLIGVAQRYIAAGVKTPEELAGRLAGLAEGRLVPFSQSLWSAFKQTGVEGVWEPDWASIYENIDKTASKPQNGVTNASGTDSPGTVGTGPVETGAASGGTTVPEVAGSENVTGTTPFVEPGQPGGGGGGGGIGGRGNGGNTVPGNAGTGNAGRNDRPGGVDKPGGGRGRRDPGSGPGGSDVLTSPPVVPVPENEEDRNARIDPSERLVPSGAKAKIEANFRAIALLQKLEDEGRNPTSEEKRTLLAYSGWGAFKDAFNDAKREEFESARNQWLDQEWQRSEAEFKQNRNQKRIERNGTEKPSYYELYAWNKRYGEVNRRLHDLMGQDEYDAARRSVLNAHYTTPEIIGKMWMLLERLGFNGGRVLEPSGGIGHYIGTQPAHLAERSEWSAVELDRITARILGKLYPQARVNSVSPNPSRTITGQGFEEAKIANNSMDLVISNVPFHEKGPWQSKKQFGIQFNLHNYFFARAIEKAKPGGLVAFITSSSTMENNAQQRDMIASMGDLVTAIRLPNTAFKENAGTEVTTDIIIIRKPDGTPFAKQAWARKKTVGTDVVHLQWNRQTTTADSIIRSLDPEGQWKNAELEQARIRYEQARMAVKMIPPTRKSELPTARNAESDAYRVYVETMERKLSESDYKLDASLPIRVNEFFADHPENAFGKHSLQGSMYSANEYTLSQDDSGPGIPERFDALAESLPADIMGIGKPSEAAQVRDVESGDSRFSFVERDGQIYQVEADSLQPVDWSEKQKAVFRSWSPVKEAIRSLVAQETNPLATDQGLAERRTALNAAYDTHVRKFGPISKTGRAARHDHLMEDPDFPLTTALEDEVKEIAPNGKVTVRFVKSDIFTRRMNRPMVPPDSAETAEEADPLTPIPEPPLGLRPGQGRQKQFPSNNPEALPAQSTETQRARADRFTCPKCGARMVFDGDGRTLICEHCARSQGLNNSAPEFEQDFILAMATGKGHRKPVAMKTFNCQGCGAQFLLPPEKISSVCAYCGSPHVVVGTQDLVEPDAIIPMAFDQHQAIRRIGRTSCVFQPVRDTAKSDKGASIKSLEG